MYKNLFDPYNVPISVVRFFYGFWTSFESACFIYFIWLNINNTTFKKVILIASLFFLIFIIRFYLLFDFNRIDSIPIGIESILIFLFSFYFLYEQMNNPENLFIYNDYRFWMVLAFIIYLSGSFFIYLFAEQIPKSQILQYWMFTDVFYAIKNIFFSIGILNYALRKPVKKHLTKKSAHYYSDLT